MVLEKQHFSKKDELHRFSRTKQSRKVKFKMIKSLEGIDNTQAKDPPPLNFFAHYFLVSYATYLCN